MAEKSTRIANAASGNYIATRDAYAPDTDTNARTIQLFDIASRQIESWSDLRGTAAAPISSNDSPNLDSFSTTKLTIGDKACLVVAVYHSQNNGSVDITPIAYMDDGRIVVLETKTTGMGNLLFTRDISGTKYLSPVLAWDVLGAKEISLFISAITASNAVYIQGATI